MAVPKFSGKSNESLRRFLYDLCRFPAISQAHSEVHEIEIVSTACFKGAAFEWVLELLQKNAEAQGQPAYRLRVYTWPNSSNKTRFVIPELGSWDTLLKALWSRFGPKLKGTPAETSRSGATTPQSIATVDLLDAPQAAQEPSEMARLIHEVWQINLKVTGLTELFAMSEPSCDVGRTVRLEWG